VISIAPPIGTLHEASEAALSSRSPKNLLRGLHKNLVEDPAALQRTEEDRLSLFRRVRDEMRGYLKVFPSQIAFTAENTANGAQVRIVTGSPEALEAVHEFLRFQIKDHRTNDPLATQ
jgi:hypothetical protein